MAGAGPPDDSNDNFDEDQPDDPFGLPFIGELMKLFQGSGQLGGDHGRQIARSLANGGVSEPNIDPSDRIAVEELVRVAELRVEDATGLSVARESALRVEVANRSQWSDRTIDDYADLFAQLSASMMAGLTPASPTDLADGGSDDLSGGDPSDPMAAMSGLFEGISQMLGPMMLSMTTGSMVGQLAQRALSGYDLPVPRPADKPILVLLRNLDEFGQEWSLDKDDLRLWVCLHETAHHAVFGVAHVRQRLNELLTRHASSFETNPNVLDERFGSFDLSAGPEALAELQATLGNPDALLGAVRSPAQDALQPDLTALIAAITGYVDHVMDGIGSSLMGSYGQLTEALRRRRVEAGASDRFVERILGLELDRDQYDRGAAFASGIVERAGEDGLRRLFSDPAHLPTPAEVDAPGLWLARIDLA